MKNAKFSDVFASVSTLQLTQITNSPGGVLSQNLLWLDWQMISSLDTLPSTNLILTSSRKTQL
jgi:hypothetical protein